MDEEIKLENVIIFLIKLKLKKLINYILNIYAIKHLLDYLRSFKKGNYWVRGVGNFMYFADRETCEGCKDREDCKDCEFRFFYREWEHKLFNIDHDINFNSSTDTFNWEQVKSYREIISNLENLYEELRTNYKYKDSEIEFMIITILEPGKNDYDAGLVFRVDGNSIYAVIKDLHIIRIEL
ncbi:MAG: hypothetical protein ACYC25_02950 [Paludibacter sp.]